MAIASSEEAKSSESCGCPAGFLGNRDSDRDLLGLFLHGATGSTLDDVGLPFECVGRFESGGLGGVAGLLELGPAFWDAWKPGEDAILPLGGDTSCEGEIWTVC